MKFSFPIKKKASSNHRLVSLSLTHTQKKIHTLSLFLSLPHTHSHSLTIIDSFCLNQALSYHSQYLVVRMLILDLQHQSGSNLTFYISISDFRFCTLVMVCCLYKSSLVWRWIKLWFSTTFYSFRVKKLL